VAGIQFPNPRVQASPQNSEHFSTGRFLDLMRGNGPITIALGCFSGQAGVSFQRKSIRKERGKERMKERKTLPKSGINYFFCTCLL